VKHRRPVLVIAVLTAAVSLAACSSSNSTASNSAAHSTTSNSATQTTALGSSSPAATSSSSISTHTSGMCSSIDQQTAESILGFATAAGISSSAGSGGAVMKKIDGCFYEGGTNGSLGYDVAQVDTQIGQAMISAAKAKMAAAGPQVTAFDTGLPNSFAFTQHLPAGVDSQVTVVSGDRLITVAATRKDGNVDKSQASATAAAKTLVSHT